MSIILRLGNIGSGKSLCAVKDMVENINGLRTYTNIGTKKVKNVTQIKPEMIIKRDTISVNKQGIPKFKMSVNINYWKKLKQGINVVLDEAHTMTDARKSQSNVNKTVNNWIALIRRVLGESDARSGDLILISQLERRIDPIIREMAHMIMFHTCYYEKRCKDCGRHWKESSDSSEKMSYCISCRGFNLEKFNHEVHVHYFTDIQSFYQWQYHGRKTQFRIQILKNLQQYFQFYDTVQWDNLTMFEDYY